MFEKLNPNKMIYNKKLRHNIYSLVLSEQKFQEYGLCHALLLAIEKVCGHPLAGYFNQFVELKQYKPPRAKEHHYWFPFSQDGDNIRLQNKAGRIVREYLNAIGAKTMKMMTIL